MLEEGAAAPYQTIGLLSRCPFSCVCVLLAALSPKLRLPTSYFNQSSCRVSINF